MNKIIIKRQPIMALHLSDSDDEGFVHKVDLFGLSLKEKHTLADKSRSGRKKTIHLCSMCKHSGHYSPTCWKKELWAEVGILGMDWNELAQVINMIPISKSELIVEIKRSHEEMKRTYANIKKTNIIGYD